jgi:hypothetical protein
MILGVCVLVVFCAPNLVSCAPKPVPVQEPVSAPIIYPINNQTKEQQERDEYECYKWAKNQSGFDPVSTQTASTPPPEPQKKDRTVLRSAARSAAMGAAVGGITGNSDDAKEGAQVGAAVGGLSGAFRKRDASRQQEAAAQNQTAQMTGQNSTYARAFAACMGGRGYNVQ